jgi:hypothetical protein
MQEGRFMREFRAAALHRLEIAPHGRCVSPPKRRAILWAVDRLLDCDDASDESDLNCSA